MSVRIGVIGAGVMGADHATTLHRYVRGATVAAVADVAPDRAASAASESGARACDDARTLIADPGVDAVVIASHDSVHAEQILAATEADNRCSARSPSRPPWPRPNDCCRRSARVVRSCCH